MTLGPNTNAPSALLAPKCILCCGEDRPTLLAAMTDAGLSPPASAAPAANFTYRCYEFWRQPDLLLIWTGIGTGCLEPLLWEILRPGVIRQMVLVGTAARMPRSSATVGSAYLIGQAWSAGTGLDGEGLEQPFGPRWPGLGHPHGRSPTTSSVSTDFFFGFSPHVRTGGYPLATGRLRSAYDEHDRRGTDLVEMEVAPFYAFCASFPGSPSHFIAAKGVSNTLGVDEEQVPHSRQAIAEAVRIARDLLGL